MDAFEQVVAEILWMQGYWVRTSVKVELTKEEKRRIGRPSSPRWELDVVAYQARDNVLKVVECKSLLDSRGVGTAALDGYKLFNEQVLREVVFQRLRQQFYDSGACLPNPEIRLCLACGRIPSEADRGALHTRFSEAGWELWDEHWLRDRLREMANRGYENQVAAVVSKLLLRGMAV